MEYFAHQISVDGIFTSNISTRYILGKVKSVEQIRFLKHMSTRPSCAGVQGHGHIQEGLLSGEEPALLPGNNVQYSYCRVMFYVHTARSFSMFTLWGDVQEKRKYEI